MTEIQYKCLSFDIKSNISMWKTKQILKELQANFYLFALSFGLEKHNVLFCGDENKQ